MKLFYRLDNFRIKSTDAGADPDAQLPEFIVRQLGLRRESLRRLRILSRSTDSRRGVPVLLYSAVFELDGEPAPAAGLERIDADRFAALSNPPLPVWPKPGPELRQPLVVGTGPCGIFAALALAEAGCRPVIVERGFPVDRRQRDYETMKRTRLLDPESNLLIGEGGAGAFSDGKLYTGTRDERAAYILKTFVEAGAPPEILHLKRPHIGSDYLAVVASGLRRKLEALGATFVFGTNVTDVVVENSRCAGIVTAAGEQIRGPAVLLAFGLGGRELNATLRARGAAYELKGFQVGCRIEHPQELIDRRQYRIAPRPAALGAAEYHLVSRPPRAPAVSSFCMCPGGEVVMASAWENRVVSNGMSLHARDGAFANAALITTLDPSCFGSAEAAFEQLDRLERAAFELGGGDYTFPAQDAAGFLSGRSLLRNRAGSAAVGLRAARLDELLPPPVRDGIGAALQFFDRQCPGFIRHGKLIGVETCVSSPVRFRRDPETLVSSIPGLYLGGEGAGCAGGIMSAAADGLKIAHSLLGNCR